LAPLCGFLLPKGLGPNRPVRTGQPVPQFLLQKPFLLPGTYYFQPVVVCRDISPKFLGFILFGMITNIYPWYQPGIDIPPVDLAFSLIDLFLTGIVPH
jgi:hypothetical protein